MWQSMSELERTRGHHRHGSPRPLNTYTHYTPRHTLLAYVRNPKESYFLLAFSTSTDIWFTFRSYHPGGLLTERRFGLLWLWAEGRVTAASHQQGGVCGKHTNTHTNLRCAGISECFFLPRPAPRCGRTPKNQWEGYGVYSSDILLQQCHKSTPTTWCKVEISTCKSSSIQLQAEKSSFAAGKDSFNSWNCLK